MPVKSIQFTAIFSRFLLLPAFAFEIKTDTSRPIDTFFFILHFLTSLRICCSVPSAKSRKCKKRYSPTLLLTYEVMHNSVCRRESHCTPRPLVDCIPTFICTSVSAVLPLSTCTQEDSTCVACWSHGRSLRNMHCRIGVTHSIQTRVLFSV